MVQIGLEWMEKCRFDTKWIQSDQNGSNLTKKSYLIIRYKYLQISRFFHVVSDRFFCLVGYEKAFFSFFQAKTIHITLWESGLLACMFIRHG